MTGGDMIRKELELKRQQLVARKQDLEQAKRHIAELQETCSGLANTICQLEQDEKALTRGHVALMCERA